MKTINIYVDAENVSFDTFEKYFKEVKEQFNNYKIIGKVYGGKDILGSTVSKYLMKGFIYVETSTLSCNKKNLTDMKLIVDCMEDLVKDTTEIECIYLISKDSDFLPLVYKIISMDIKVKTLITVHDNGMEKNLTSLVQALKDTKYLPVTGERVLGTPFRDISSLVGNEYDKDLIVDYVTNRRSKFSSALRYIGEDFEEKINSIDIEKFNFFEVSKVLGIKDKKLFENIFDIYTTKMFGTTLKSKERYCVFKERSVYNGQKSFKCTGF